MSKEKKTKTSRKRMTPAEWGEAVALWESGEFTLQQISKKLSITKSHLSRKFKKEGVKKGDMFEETKAAVEEETKSVSAEHALLLAKRVTETKEEHYQWSVAIGKMAMQVVAKARNDGHAISTASEDLKALNHLINIEQKVRSERYACLGLDKEDFVDGDDLPDLPIQDLTGEEIEEIRNKATQSTMGIDDGMGGILSVEENEIVEEGFDEKENGGDSKTP